MTQNRVKEYREKLGISQEELAERTGISRTTISNIENYKQEVITNVTMKKIANVLDRKVQTIFSL